MILIADLLEKYLDRVSSLPKRMGAHDIGHTKRVLTLASMISETEELSEIEQKNLFDAALYHDSGRTDDSANENHGKASYFQFFLDNGADATVEFLIIYHCIHDELAKIYWDAHDFSLPKERIWLLYEILKDADALDRVRFGKNGLNEKFLRRPQSHELIEAARLLFLSSKAN